MAAPILGLAPQRAAFGAALVVFPGWVASAAAGHPATPAARLFTRVLGMRHLVQAALTLAAPQLLTPSRGAVVDGLHTATMVVLAAVNPRHRRAALGNAAVAALFAGLGVLSARTQRGREREPAKK